MMRSKFSTTLSLVFLLSSFVPLFFMDRLEGARVPAHFNLTGVPDRWDGGTALLLLPFIASFIYVLMLMAGRWPQMINYPVRKSSKSTEQMHAVGVKYIARYSMVVMMLFSYLANSSLMVALGKWDKMPSGPLYVIVGAIVFLTVMFYRDVK